ncbi:uncharacterized protein LOC143465759 [Clavelina lepadiformis]|uniref:uncharacterized protein LOC143465759 n=1 Tax=Clavelina lepadiformis TaxID=159417 RepID=UPI00404213CB
MASSQTGIVLVLLVIFEGFCVENVESISSTDSDVKSLFFLGFQYDEGVGVRAIFFLSNRTYPSRVDLKYWKETSPDSTFDANFLPKSGINFVKLSQISQSNDELVCAKLLFEEFCYSVEEALDLPEAYGVKVVSVNVQPTISWKYDPVYISNGVAFEVQYKDIWSNSWEGKLKNKLIRGLKYNFFRFIHHPEYDDSLFDPSNIGAYYLRVRPCLTEVPSKCGGWAQSKLFQLPEDDTTSHPDFEILDVFAGNYLRIKNNPHMVEQTNKSLECYHDGLKYLISYWSDNDKTQPKHEYEIRNFSQTLFSLPLHTRPTQNVTICVKMAIGRTIQLGLNPNISKWEKKCKVVSGQPPDENATVFVIILVSLVAFAVAAIGFIIYKVKRFYVSVYKTESKIPKELLDVLNEMENLQSSTLRENIQSDTPNSVEIIDPLVPEPRSIYSSSESVSHSYRDSIYPSEAGDTDKSSLSSVASSTATGSATTSFVVSIPVSSQLEDLPYIRHAISADTTTEISYPGTPYPDDDHCSTDDLWQCQIISDSNHFGPNTDIWQINNIDQESNKGHGSETCKLPLRSQTGSFKQPKTSVAFRLSKRRLSDSQISSERRRNTSHFRKSSLVVDNSHNPPRGCLCRDMKDNPRVDTSFQDNEPKPPNDRLVLFPVVSIRSKKAKIEQNVSTDKHAEDLLSRFSVVKADTGVLLSNPTYTGAKDANISDSEDESDIKCKSNQYISLHGNCGMPPKAPKHAAKSRRLSLSRRYSRSLSCGSSLTGFNKNLIDSDTTEFPRPRQSLILSEDRACQNDELSRKCMSKHSHHQLHEIPGSRTRRSRTDSADSGFPIDCSFFSDGSLSPPPTPADFNPPLSNFFNSAMLNSHIGKPEGDCRNEHITEICSESTSSGLTKITERSLNASNDVISSNCDGSVFLTSSDVAGTSQGSCRIFNQAFPSSNLDSISVKSSRNFSFGEDTDDELNHQEDISSSYLKLTALGKLTQISHNLSDGLY